MSAGIDFTALPDYEVWPISRSWPFMASFTFEEIWSGVTIQGSLDVKADVVISAIIDGVEYDDPGAHRLGGRRHLTLRMISGHVLTAKGFGGRTEGPWRTG